LRLARERAGGGQSIITIEDSENTEIRPLSQEISVTSVTLVKRTSEDRMAHVAEESGRRMATHAQAGERGRIVAQYIEDFERFDRSTASHQPAWLAEARRAAISRFGELGFPTTRQ